MRASETVIKLDGTTKNESLHIVMNGILREQAEISFKAGIKEVVEWIEENAYPPAAHRDIRRFRHDEWQAKLKEWELEDEVTA